MMDASDVCMKRVTKRNKRKQVYWLNEEIDGARSAAIRSRRRWTRARRKNISQEGIRALIETYKAQKKILSRLIFKAKENSWKDLVAAIDEDPWGIPYRMVMGKLRGAVPGLTET